MTEKAKMEPFTETEHNSHDVIGDNLEALKRLFPESSFVSGSSHGFWRAFSNQF